MRAAVTGGGAVGALLAHALALAGNDVSLVHRRHAGLPERRPLTRIDPDGSRSAADVTVVGSPGELTMAPDVAVFAVKMFDLRAATESWSIWPDVSVVTVQNGIGAEELVRGLRPTAAVIAASLTSPVAGDDGGAVRRFRTGGIGLALAGSGGASLRDGLVEAFARAGLPARAYDDAPSMKWSKLLGNLVGNATGALADLDPPDVYAHPRLLEVERRQVLEASAVMRRRGHRTVALPGAAVQWLPRLAALPTPLAGPILRRVVARGRGGKPPSLREHLRSRMAGPSEVEWLNGAVARAGAEAGVTTPVNQALFQLVTEATADAAVAARLAGQPDRVADAIATRAGIG